MKREIKFKGKSVKSGKWLYGYLGESKGKILQSIYREKIIFENLEWFNTDNFGFVVNDYMVDEDTICQFTGMNDKKGKEVYEHDILRVFDGKSYFNVTVVWSGKAMAFMCCFCDNNLSPLSWFSNILSKEYEIEVIGNIFDNKELLNQE